MRMSSNLRATLTPEKNSLAIAPVSMAQPRSPWHSPVPYLFGGLATMLGLIAFALLILACSYWRLSRDDTQQQQSNDLENGGNNKGDGVSKLNGSPIFEDKIVVIMAGNHKPTFLATPSLMLFSNNNKDNNTSNDHDHDGHVMVGTTNNVKDDGAKESTSVQEEENLDENDHDHDHDDNDDGDDEKAKEDETTNPHN